MNKIFGLLVKLLFFHPSKQDSKKILAFFEGSALTDEEKYFDSPIGELDGCLTKDSIAQIIIMNRSINEFERIHFNECKKCFKVYDALRKYDLRPSSQTIKSNSIRISN